ncbi:MAG: UDP-glucose 4-epimerase GalE [Ignavibacteriae bacterium HGW-Ignavibacteriae-3]|nr:MAG: UDP-glucose 4-epimerase GalE [Ignavibacteriae bacterium HGW-Ignavibacteriae-3]
MKILVTGGAGYIGSHFVRYLANNGHHPVVLDNLSRGHIESIPTEIPFEDVDIIDSDSVLDALRNHEPSAVVHFAGYAYVGESVEHPEIYYQNNVAGSLNLIRLCAQNGIKNFIFSSTCSIYGNPAHVPISEEQPPNPINPYANTKLMIEMILKDFESAFGMKHVALRYFNAAGADPSGLIGESHNPEPHLIPIILNVALGKRSKVSVYGNDYETPDGTCIRDYVHVNDLAAAHLKAVEYLNKGNSSSVINLGTGRGNSVLEIIKKAEDITKKKIPYDIVSRRPGDPAMLLADNSKAKDLFNWAPEFAIDEIIQSAWHWHKKQKY